MKFRDERSGVVYEPSDERVALWMAQNPNMVTLDVSPTAAPEKEAKKATKKKTK